MKVTFTKEELESIIVEHNDKEDDINKVKTFVFFAQVM
jgi:hypothetical protein